MKNLFSTFILLLVVLLHAQATKHIITASGTSFSPNSIATGVNVGDTIRWQWGNGGHTTTSTTIPSGAAAWSNPLDAGNTSFEYTVTVAGVYNYKCIPHESFGMIGSFTATAVIVNPCDTLVCDDSDLCTTDTCTNNACVNTPIICDDADSCTTDACVNGVCTFTPILGCGVGIKEPSELANLRLFPNPVKDVLNIDGAQSMLTHVYIMDISGKQLFDSGEINTLQYSIQTKSFVRGTYFLHIHSKAGEAVRKVLVGE